MRPYNLRFAILRFANLRFVAGVLCAAVVTPGVVVAQTSPGAEAQRTLSVGGLAGFANGFSLQGQLLAADLAPSLPIQARLRLGYTRLDPGSSSEARRVFINNATNGTPEKAGRVLGVDFDVLWPSTSVPGDQGWWWAGVRHSSFRGNFRYVGGNADFDVTTSQWGVGMGAESRFTLGPRTWLVVDVGVDWFFGSRLQGHDTSYSPDEDNVNPREDFGYADADGAINQLKLRPVLLLGVQRRLGGE